MATYRAIAATSEAILGLLKRACPKPEFEGALFELYQVNNFQNPMDEGVSLYLYRVGTSSRRNLPARLGPKGEHYRPPLPLDLYYLLTTWGKTAAKTFFCKLLKGLTYVPRVVVTDQLRSYSAAMREILPTVEHRQHRYLNNRAENSHQPTRQRERRMQGFKSPGQAQRFLAVYGPIAQHFRPRRHRLSASNYRQEMQRRFDTWQELTTLPTAA